MAGQSPKRPVSLFYSYSHQDEDLRQKLAEAKSFKGLQEQFTEALREFKANWQPDEAEA